MTALRSRSSLRYSGLCYARQNNYLAACNILASEFSPCVLVQPDGWARGEREAYGGPCDVTSLSLISSARGTPSTRQWQAEAGMSSPKSRLKKPAWSRSTRMFHEEIK